MISIHAHTFLGTTVHLMVSFKSGEDAYNGGTIVDALTPELIQSLRADLDRAEVFLAKKTKEQEIKARIEAEMASVA